MPASNRPKDMRTWIDELKAAGELVRIDKPVDPLTQMGSLLYQSREKALFFEQLPHGWRSLGQAPANVRHAAIAFGVTQDKLIPTVAERMGNNIPPVMVADGPVKEKKFAKGEFDLTKLPVHIAGQRDGGEFSSAADQGTQQVGHPPLSSPQLEKLFEISRTQ